jgi:hypothetical protein
MTSAGVLPAQRAFVDDIKTRMASDILAPEFRLTTACCRWPPSQSRDATVRAVAAGVSDWNRFLSEVKRQRVIGLVHAALFSAGIELPPAIAEELASRARRIVRRNLILTGEAVRLQQLLSSAGIPVLVLKGAALAQLAYGSLDIKQTRDLDLLVPPDRAEAALQILERDGFVLDAPAKHLSGTQRRALIQYAREVEIVRRGRKLRVELQWRAVYNPMLLQGVDANSPTQSVALSDGLSVRTLALDDLFAFLCVHGAHHAWSRLKWLADVNALLASHGADLERLYRHAQKIGAGLCAGQALLLCRRLFDLQLPAGLADEIGARRRVKKLVAMAVTAMTAPHAETEVDGGVAGVMRVVHTQFLLGQGFAFYAAQCRLAAAGPADVIRFPLPRALHFLYPLVRLPLWLWRRAAAARGRRSP